MSLSFPDLPYEAIMLQGKDINTFLQGQITTDVQLCTDCQFAPGYFCQHTGKVLANAYAFIYNADSAILLCHKSVSNTLLAHLKPYAALSRVSMSIQTDVCYGLIHEHQAPHASKPYHYVRQDQCTHAMISHTTSLIFGPHHAVKTWFAKNQHTNIAHTDLWYYTLMQEAFSLLSSESANLFTPNMLSDVPSLAVSLSKGCYNGQEIIARTHHLGKPKRKRQLFTCTSFSAHIPTGSQITLLDRGQIQAHVLVSAMHSQSQTLWLDLVAPITQGPQSFLFSPPKTPENVISFTAEPFNG